MQMIIKERIYNAPGFWIAGHLVWFSDFVRIPRSYARRIQEKARGD